jgi:hypothetical protein
VTIIVAERVKAAVAADKGDIWNGVAGKIKRPRRDSGEKDHAANFAHTSPTSWSLPSFPLYPSTLLCGRGLPQR